MPDFDNSWAQIDTPALLVDLDLMERNIQRWQADFDAAGVDFRPHIKTHKSPDIAACQLAAGAVGLAVAKTAEAEVFAAAGCRDIAVAYPVIGESKWRRLAELARNCVITVNVESEIGARGLSNAAVRAGSVIRVLIDIDLGLHRTGIAPEGAGALGRLIMELPGLELSGITSYRSIGFAGAAGRERDDIGREEGELLVALADDLRTAGLPIQTVAAGSTPTAHGAAQVPGVTEVRAGTYVFNDEMSLYRGTSTPEEVALSILCTVVSRPLPERATIDGGSKTFSGEVPPGAWPGLVGYARAIGVDANLEAIMEEHGMVRLGPGVDPSVGDKLRFIPNHVCPTVNLSDELIMMRNGRVVAVWPVTARGKRT